MYNCGSCWLHWRDVQFGMKNFIPKSSQKVPIYSFGFSGQVPGATGSCGLHWCAVCSSRRRRRRRRAASPIPGKAKATTGQGNPLHPAANLMTTQQLRKTKFWTLWRDEFCTCVTAILSFVISHHPFSAFVALVLAVQQFHPKMNTIAH